MAKKREAARYTLSAEVMQGIEEHAYSNLTAEVGGMLMGSVRNGTTTIVGAIPALSASAEQVTLTFTHEVWEEILQLAAKEFPNDSIVGWYHTHPTFGIFLSDYDLFIQENFFNAEGHLALVLDPVQGAYGWFGKNSKGQVEVFEEGQTATGPKRSIDPFVGNSGDKKNGSARLIAVGALGLLLGGAVGTGIALSQIPPDLSGALETTKAELAQVGGQYNLLQQIFADPVLAYVLVEGDTIDSLASMFYLEANAGRSLLMGANGVSRYEVLEPGGLFLVPSPTRFTLTGLRPADVQGEIPDAPEDPLSEVIPDSELQNSPEESLDGVNEDPGEADVPVETLEGDAP